MNKLFHLSWECSIPNRSQWSAYALKALRDEQIVLLRHTYHQWSAIVRNRQLIKRNILAQFEASKYLQIAQPFFIKMQWLSCATKDGHRTNNRLTVADVQHVHWTVNVV